MPFTQRHLPCRFGDSNGKVYRIDRPYVRFYGIDIYGMRTVASFTLTIRQQQYYLGNLVQAWGKEASAGTWVVSIEWSRAKQSRSHPRAWQQFPPK